MDSEPINTDPKHTQQTVLTESNPQPQTQQELPQQQQSSNKEVMNENQQDDDDDDIELEEDDSDNEKPQQKHKKQIEEDYIYQEDQIDNDNDSDSIIEEDQSIIEDDENEEQSKMLIDIQGEKKPHEKVESIKLRDYQLLLFEKSKGKNSIIYLPTGTGKTMVAITAMYYTLCREGKDRKIIFLANTIQLVKQQAESIKKNLLKIIKDQATAKQLRGPDRVQIINWTEEDIKSQVCCIHGEKNEDLGVTRRKKIENQLIAKKELLAQFNRSTIIVMISQIFLNSLRRGYIRLPDCSMIILDECHHCSGEHPYAGIMKEFYFDKPKYFDLKNKEVRMPIIMGLTASPVAQATFNKDQLVRDLKDLAEHLDSQYTFYQIEKLRNETDIQIVETVETQEKQLYPDLISYFEKVRDHHQSYRKIQIHFPKYFKCVEEVITTLISEQQKLGLEIAPSTLTDIDLLLFYDVKECLLIKLRDIWLQLGQFAFTLAFNQLVATLHKIVLKSAQNKALLSTVVQILLKYLKQFNAEFGKCDRKFFSAKVNKLIDFLQKPKQNLDFVQDPRKVEMVVVFAAKRRTVKYLDELLQQYKKTILDEEEAKRFDCKGVTGYSAKTFSNFARNQVTYYSDISGEKSYAQVERKYEQYLKEISESNRLQTKQDQGESENLSNQMKRMKNVKFGKLLLEVQEKYSNQIKKINEFKKKKYRVLITTSVTEEGFDIPECNMVISFDEPKSLKSYIQIKGRARKQNSQYIIFTTQISYEKMVKDKEMFEDTIQATEEIAINKFAKNQDLNGKVMVRRPFKPDPEYQKIIVKDSNAIINTNYSLEILKIYCAALRQPNKPKFYFVQTPNLAYRCLVFFPPTATTTKPYIIGNPEKSKHNSIRSAAFEAVKYLYKGGYIKSDLRPKKYEELQDERQIERFEDIAETKKNDEYKRIFEEDVRIHIDSEAVTDRKFIRFYFRSITSPELDFDKINPSFQKHLKVFDKQKFKFQIYMMNFDNNQNIKDLKKSDESNEIGILTCFQENYVGELFANYHYAFEENSRQGFQFRATNRFPQLNKAQYEKLKRIHEFLLAGVDNKEHQYYRYLSQTEPVKSSWISSIKKIEEESYRNPQRKYYPLLVLLKKRGEQYVIDETLNHKIEQHAKIFTQIYRYHNVGSRTETTNKFPKNLSEPIRNFATDLKSTADYDKYIVQDLDREFCFHKCIITSREDYNENMDQGKNKKDNLSKRHKKLRTMFEHPKENIRDVVKIILWRKYRKEKKGQLFQREGNMLIKNSENSRFFLLDEFFLYPLSPATLFKATLAAQFAFKALFEYSVAFSFRNLKLKEIINRKIPLLKNQNLFRFRSYQNIILDNAAEVFKFLTENSGSQYLRNIGKTYEKPSKFVIPEYELSFSLNQSMIEKKNNNSMSMNDTSLNLQMLGNQTMENINNSTFLSEAKDNQLYSASQKNVKITQISKVLTSRMYKFSKYDNYEQYEFIGDVVLKMLSTVQIFLEKPDCNESQLHISRANIICNANLHRKGILREVYKYIFAKKYNQLPPPFAYNIKKDEADEKDFYDDTKIRKYNKTCQLQGFQYIPGKVHADVVEALIGAFYLHERNLEDCQSLLYAFDILKKPNLKINFDHSNRSNPGDLPRIYRDFQARIKYTFNDKGLLLQALTHSSFQSILHICIDKNNIQDYSSQSILDTSKFMSVDSKSFNEQLFSKTNGSQTYYERLEFLGDSILDLIVVEYLYEKFGTKDQGSLTLLKQAGVSNRSLGMIALKYGMHELILMDHPDNDQVMKDFRKILNEFNRFLNNPAALIQSKIDSIKLLGDVFEALVGAIYLDREMNYVETKKIIMNMISQFLDHYTAIQQSKNSSTNFKYQEYLQKNNYHNCQIKKSFEDGIEDGRFKFLLVDRTGSTVDYCWEFNEKRAWDAMIEKFMEKLQP